jgi:hypothetical protein
MPASYATALAQGTSFDWAWTEFWLAPLLVLVVARRVLGERAGPGLWACAVLVPVAAWLVHSPQGPSSLTHLVLPFAMSVSFGLYVIFTRILGTDGLVSNLVCTAVVPFVVLAPHMPGIWRIPTMHDALVLVAIGAIGLLALALLDRAVRRCRAVVIAPVLGLQIAFASLLMRHLHGASSGKRDAIAALLLGGMVVWIWRREGSSRGNGLGTTT